jgi:TnpA family transposase
LLVVGFEERQTEFNRLKKLPQRPSRQHLEDLLDHLDWLKSFGDVDGPLAGIAPTKIRNFAQQAKALDAGELKDFAPANRCTLLLCLIHRMRVRTRDDIGEMLLKRMATIHKRAKEELVEIQLEQRQKTEKLIGRLDEVAAIAASDLSDLQTGRRVRAVLSADGGVEKLREECAAVRLWQGDNYLPLLRKHFVPLRYVLFRLVRAVELQSTTQDQALLKALEVVLAYERKRVDWIAVDDVDLSFASDRWQKLLKDSEGGPKDRINRRQLEICVFSHLAAELKSGDISIAGSESFADYRQHLLTWEECNADLKEFCQQMDLPDTATGFVKDLKTKLTETAARVDQKYPENGDLTISPSGEPVLKKVTAKEIPESAVTLQANITQKMPTRNLLDILVNIEHWTNFTRHFGPLSGSDPKLERAAERYIQTVFAIGCNLGPNQAARHMAGAVSAHTLSFVNRRHFTVEKLEAAQRELIELYLQLDLPKLWGDGRTVAADGTQYDFYEENLLAGYHFRYRKMGAVAYRHVANNYVAVFCHFIPPGVWEAVYVIEGLMKAGQLSVQADTVHSDTQGQSTTVFAFTHLLGIHLMPRIRNWKDLHFFRPSKKTRYKHIDSLFTETIDWDLIETHWKDLMQVALSIQAGKISSALLLRKLGNQSRQNRLFLAAQEVGRAVRTIFLLDWISSLPLRQHVTGTTNKIESYNGFSKWLSFGGEVIGENDPDEQQKHLRYNDLVATAVILQNTVDMARIVADLKREGWKVSPADLAFLSPYQTSTVKRFGEYVVNLNRPPEPWIKEVVVQFKPAKPQLSALPLVKEA